MIARLLRFVRFSHTIFALPFALGSMLVAAHGWPSWQISALIVIAMVFARTAAMTFNRLADWQIDQRNPRTVERHRLVSRSAAIGLLVITSAAFVFTTKWINPLCFALSPVALIIVFFYSLTKRFTSLSHFFLGLALSVSPVGAWLAVTGSFALAPLVLALAVLLWVAGFDVIYATQDHEFDRSVGLRSLVVRRGIPRALRCAQALHWIMLAVLMAFGWLAHLGTAFYVSLILIAAAVVYEHRSAARLDVMGINRAFFMSNARRGTGLRARNLCRSGDRLVKLAVTPTLTADLRQPLRDCTHVAVSAQPDEMFRKFLLWLHLVAGFAAAIVLVLLGVTGAVMVFEAPLDHALKMQSSIASRPKARRLGWMNWSRRSSRAVPVRGRFRSGCRRRKTTRRL